MEGLDKENDKQKHQFRSYHCLNCKQTKPCYTISQERCCSCAYQIERERAKKYLDYQLVYQKKEQERQKHIQQLQLLRDYSGCPQCRSKEVDAYSFYENSQLVCQPCLMREKGGSSSPISFLEQSKWYQRHWGIDLNE